MIAYLGTRIIRWGTGLLLILFIAYAMMFYGAGDPIKRMFLDANEGSLVLEDNVLEALREKYGIDKPFPQQFASYIGNLARGDFGYSIRENRSVGTMIAVRLPISIQIGLAATVAMMVIGIPLGVISALKHNRFIDQSIVGSVVFLNAIPIFVTAPLLLWFLVVTLGVMRVPFGWKGIFHTQVILPVLILALGALPTVVRQTRAAMLEVMSEDYIRTARSKGLPNKIIIFRHMLRPVLIPVITSVSLIMIGLINGAIFIELIFNIPGFGQLTVNALETVDYPVIMSTVFIGALIVMVSNLAVDFIYPWLDPRITRN